MRILIVDDEEELVETLVERLELRGIDVEGTTEGHDALHRMKERTFDVVVVDVKMPGLGGLELLQVVKERFPEQQVVLLTGHGSAQHAEDGLRLGAFAYLMKPVKLEALIEILRNAAAKTGEAPT